MSKPEAKVRAANFDTGKHRAQHNTKAKGHECPNHQADKNDADIFTWGPRPDACQKLVFEMKDQGVENSEAKKQTQQWYNSDKGVSVQSEIINKLELYLGMRS